MTPAPRQRSGRRYRSLMFVPGHKLEWALKAPKYGPDGIILDLEDAVPDDDKTAARQTVAQAIEALRDQRVGVFVRPNAWRTGRLVGDLLAVAPSRPAGFMLPKVESPRDVIALDSLLTEIELQHGLPVGDTEIMPIHETAAAIHDLYDILMASKRILRTVGGPRRNRGGDASRALGIEWTEEGLEELYVDSKAILDAKAAGLVQIFGGAGSDIHNHDLIRRTVLRARQFGCTGATLIHPSHVPIANEIYSPSAEQIQDAQRLLTAMQHAVQGGSAATIHDGRMVDIAHAQTALRLLRDAQSFGIDVDIPAFWAGRVEAST